MKKLFLCICAVAIVALAAVNLNFALNGDSKVDLSLVNVESLAQSEGSGGNGKCSEIRWDFQVGIHYYTIWECTSGNAIGCLTGYMIIDIYNNVIENSVYMNFYGCGL